MKDDKCREDWEKWMKEPVTEQEEAFVEEIMDGFIGFDPEIYRSATSYHAGYHARKVELPSVEQIVEVIAGACQELGDKHRINIAKELHRLLVGEEGE